ncbi:MAG TPA: STAS/SEC14 domain-containing protein, partial [Chitinophagaceae bacterium]
LPNMPAHIAAYRMDRQVQAEEYDQMVIKRLAGLSREYGEANLLIQLEGELEPDAIQRIIDLFRQTFWQLGHWNRAAIVAGGHNVPLLSQALCSTLPGIVYTFSTDRANEAIAWVSGAVKQPRDRSMAVPVLLAGATGTSVMTLFSYLISGRNWKNFRETELLARLLETKFNLKDGPAEVAGWITHYSVGELFAVVYAMLVKKRQSRLSRMQTILLSAASGAVSLLSWELFFRLSPNPPKIAYKKYYPQLFIGHFLFCVATLQTYYRLADK